MNDMLAQTGNVKEKIDIRENQDLSYWSEELNLMTEELTDIVSEVGPLVHDVRLHLAKRLLLSWPSAY